MNKEDAARQTTASAYKLCKECQKEHTDGNLCDACLNKAIERSTAEVKSGVVFIHRWLK